VSISEDAYEITTEILRLMGLDPIHPFSAGSPYMVQTCLDWGWPRDAILNGVQLTMQRRRGDPPGTIKYFQNSIAVAHAEMTRVPPKVEIKPGQVITGPPSRATWFTGDAG
jgi:hypothetical protein